MPYSPNAGNDPTVPPVGGLGGGTAGGVNPPMASQIIQISAALSPAAVATITATEQIFAVAGVLASDVVLKVDKPTAQVGIGSSPLGRVSSAGNIGLTWANPTAGPITPTAAEIYKFTLLRV
jgi:hypothetical protein